MRRIIFLFLLSGQFLSCDLNGSKVKIKFDKDTYYSQRQLWQSSNVKNYSYRLRAVGFFNYDGTIIVQNGKYKENLPLENSEELSGYFMRYSSIDEVYSWIDLVFTSNNNKKPQEGYYLKEISIIYNETLHIPVEIHEIYHVSPGVSITGTFDYYISDFNQKELQ